MKKVIKKIVFTSVVILMSSFFINCNNSHKTKKKTAATLTLVHQNNLEHTVKEIIEAREPIVFITGLDKQNETYYNNARLYFKEKEYTIIEDLYSLEEIISWLNTHKTKNPYGEIHIVNKSNPFKGMSLETVINGENVTAESLRRNITKGALPILSTCINADSKIIFHANGLANNTELIQNLRDAFCTDELPTIIASPYFTIFGDKLSKHYLAKPFYIFYPTANSPGKVDLSKEIANKYPEENDIDWLDALRNKEERFVGDAYTTQFTIPVKFELDYHNSDDEVPTFESQEEVMDFIEQQEMLFADIKKLNINLEKFRWTWYLKNSKLTILGKTTGLIVLKPLIKPYGKLKHIVPNTNNKRLYATH